MTAQGTGPIQVSLRRRDGDITAVTRCVRTRSINIERLIKNRSSPRTRIGAKLRRRCGHSRLSSPAKAGDPVPPELHPAARHRSDRPLAITGCPAFAGHDSREAYVSAIARALRPQAE